MHFRLTLLTKHEHARTHAHTQPICHIYSYAGIILSHITNAVNSQKILIYTDLQSRRDSSNLKICFLDLIICSYSHSIH
jgi:hypothetical protein